MSVLLVTVTNLVTVVVTLHDSHYPSTTSPARLPPQSTTTTTTAATTAAITTPIGSRSAAGASTPSGGSRGACAAVREKTAKKFKRDMAWACSAQLVCLGAPGGEP